MKPIFFYKQINNKNEFDLKKFDRTEISNFLIMEIDQFKMDDQIKASGKVKIILNIVNFRNFISSYLKINDID